MTIFVYVIFVKISCFFLSVAVFISRFHRPLRPSKVWLWITGLELRLITWTRIAGIQFTTDRLTTDRFTTDRFTKDRFTTDRFTNLLTQYWRNSVTKQASSKSSIVDWIWKIARICFVKIDPILPQKCIHVLTEQKTFGHSRCTSLTTAAIGCPNNLNYISEK